MEAAQAEIERQTHTSRLTDTGTVARQTPVNICSQCGNILWHYRPCPRDRTKLQRVCKNCPNIDEMESNLVYVNDLTYGDTQASYAIAGKDMVKDPTLPLSDEMDCSTCGHNEAVFFQKPAKASDEGMKLIFMCTKCAPSAGRRLSRAPASTLARSPRAWPWQMRVPLGAVSRRRGVAAEGGEGAASLDRRVRAGLCACRRLHWGVVRFRV
jgi:DNA-directed RNA polymerase II subunit RPB9